MTWESQVRSKVIKTTLPYQIFVLFVIYYGYWQKMGQNPYRSIVSAKIWRRQCDFVFDCNVMIFLQAHLDTILLHTKIC